MVLWYSHLLKYFPQCVVAHTVKYFGIVNKAEVDVSLELSFLIMILLWLSFSFLLFLNFTILY